MRRFSYSYSVQRYSYSNGLPRASVVGRIHQGHFEYEYEYRDAEYEYDGDIRPLSGAFLKPPALQVVIDLPSFQHSIIPIIRQCRTRVFFQQ
jgi:hypothetical protein